MAGDQVWKGAKANLKNKLIKIKVKANCNKPISKGSYP